jgi:hypothetical protein
MMNWSSNSFGVVLQVNGNEKMFYNNMRDILEKTSRCSFHL